MRNYQLFCFISNEVDRFIEHYAQYNPWTQPQLKVKSERERFLEKKNLQGRSNDRKKGKRC